MSIFGNDVKLSSFPVGQSDAHVTTVTFGHHSGNLLATGSEDSTVHVYQIDQMTSLLTPQCQTSAITALRFSNEENMLASGTRSGTVKICDRESQKVIYTGGHKTCIRSMEYFPSSNNFLATAAVDGTAKLWDPRRNGFIFSYNGHNGAINALKFSPDGRYLITASDDTAIRMWDVNTGKLLKAFQEHQGPVLAIEYHPAELLFASGGADRRIKFWDLEKLQFVCETEMETSAIKCLAFEPINANYILSGSDDILHIHSWEPIQLLDTVQMNWKNVLDMTIHKDQLFGAFALQNKVYMSSINLSNLKTQRHISPVYDHFSNDFKAPSIANSTISGRRSQYQTMKVKDEHAKVQPEPSNAIDNNESRPSTANSVMIDNQERKFKSHLTNSSGRQGVSREVVTSSSISAGVDRQTPSTAEESPSIAVKSKSSQSISSPSQIDRVISAGQSRTNEQIFASLSKGNQTINSIQQQRIRNLKQIMNLSRTKSPQTNFQAIITSHDLSLEWFLLRCINEKLTIPDWNLELCTLILPAIRDLIKSHYRWYNLTACQTLEKVLRNFGKLIYDNVGAKSIGVDLSQQARRDKCQSCHHTLYEIRCLFEDRLKNLVDSSLKQVFDLNLQLLNTYERS